MSLHSTALTALMPLLRHATAHLGVEQTATGKRLGLTSGRMLALAVLDGRGTCSMSELARELRRPSPLATRVVDELVARGLVERGADAGDRRRVLLQLTAEGREAFAAVHVEAEELISSVLERMTEEETEALLVGLRAFLRELHEPPGDGIPPAVPTHEHDFPTEPEA
jgi:DNA-binding MarR family transcriptional regulator